MSEMNNVLVQNQNENETLENDSIILEEKAAEVMLDTKNETAEQQKENESAYDEALAKLNSYGLIWNFRSFRYIMDKENLAFAQLRSCVFMQGDRLVFDYLKACIEIIKAGLIGSKQIPENKPEELLDKAYEIAEDWRDSVGSLATLHIMLINRLEEKHFFMDTVTDIKILKHLSSKNLEKDLTIRAIGNDMREKMSQAQALSKSF